jgi:hypothetical protein
VEEKKLGRKGDPKLKENIKKMEDVKTEFYIISILLSVFFSWISLMRFQYRDYIA